MKSTSRSARFWRAAAGDLDPFVLVVEGSIPNEQIKDEGYWAAFGNSTRGASRMADQPMTTTEWIDRLAPHAWGIVAAGTCATYGGIHAASLGRFAASLTGDDALEWHHGNADTVQLVLTRTGVLVIEGVEPGRAGPRRSDRAHGDLIRVGGAPQTPPG
jgi:Ni,Fe-hydrogenase I small subunit